MSNINTVDDAHLECNRVLVNLTIDLKNGLGLLLRQIDNIPVNSVLSVWAKKEATSPNLQLWVKDSKRTLVLVANSGYTSCLLDLHDLVREGADLLQQLQAALILQQPMETEEDMQIFIDKIIDWIDSENYWQNFKTLKY